MSDKGAKKNNYGKQIYSAEIYTSGHKIFFTVNEKEGIKLATFSSYQGWDYQTSFGKNGKRFPLDKSGVKAMIDALTDISRYLG